MNWSSDPSLVDTLTLLRSARRDVERGWQSEALATLHELERRAASGTSGSAQDRNGLDPKGAGPTREAGDAQ